MSKSFESVNGNRTLTVEEYYGDVLLHIEGEGAAKGFRLRTSDAPALALAILEAAGYKIAQRGDMDTVQIHVDAAIYELGCAREAQERISAEARERAELEAEALELLNASNEAIGISPHSSTDFIGEIVMRRWLAVARKAREMRAEK